MPEDQTSAADAYKARMSPRDSGSDQEEELWQGGYSPKAMIGSWIAAGVISVAALVVTAIFAAGNVLLWSVVAGAIVFIWVGLALKLAYRRLSEKYRLTNHRFYRQYLFVIANHPRVEQACQHGTEYGGDPK